MEDKVVIKDSNNSIYLEISNPKQNLRRKLFVLLALIVIAFSVPIVSIITAFYLGESVSFSFVITLLIFWGCGVFFIRIFLWNKNGRECYRVYSKKFEKWNQLDLFKTDQESKEFQSIELGFVKENSSHFIQGLPSQETNALFLCFLIDGTIYFKSNIIIDNENYSKIFRSFVSLSRLMPPN